MQATVPYKGIECIGRDINLSNAAFDALGMAESVGRTPTIGGSTKRLRNVLLAHKEMGGVRGKGEVGSRREKATNMHTNL